MSTNPTGLVRFQVYSNKDEKRIVTDRRHTRVNTKSAYRPPLDIWAHWIVESILDCIVVLKQADSL